MILHQSHHRPLHSLLSSSSKYFIYTPNSLLPIIQFNPLVQQYRYYHLSPKPISIYPHFWHQKSGFYTSCKASEQQSSGNVDVVNRLAALMQKLEQLGISSPSCKPGQYTHLRCHECQGGKSKEKSLSLFITPDCNTAVWNCFRGKCGSRGTIKGFENVFGSSDMISRHEKSYTKRVAMTDRFANAASSGKIFHIEKSKTKRVITEESIGLEPLCQELIAYFAERMISGETLRRNAVMQKMQKSGTEAAIAFTYKRNGVLVSCKYRDINKHFWQEKDTEKILYGVDDIKGATDIIIVEGEIDKLSMEEAGILNCVSVPNGAPSKVSNKELPPENEDKYYQYLWNCKEYFGKASRIILATDADQPGQSLAEELALRLGRERCWRVRWPKKNSGDVCKDANEVLMFLGPHALKEMIDQAEFYLKEKIES
ncbi:hypothetical protein MKW98_002456 [Papaver atlanticum]|uniref:Toprim domain-containing protein n=1 Tax=Papaver atlanticum TaxID=357466 RepID=A0AAD4XCC8_9MAGN|nr:hypothetical protein MKW98_002456 [Papaver atlanticum]